MALGIEKRSFGDLSLTVGDAARYLAFHAVDTTQRFNPPTEVYVAQRSGSGWSDPVNVSQSQAPSSRPVIAVSPNGTVHLVWGEQLQDSTGRPGAPPSAVYYARSTDGGQTWSVPEEVFASRGAKFFTMPRSLAFDAESHPHLVFSSTESNAQPENIKHFERTSDGWEGGRIGIGGRVGGFDPDIAVGPEGRLVITYVSVDTTRTQDRNTIFFATSTDGGATWGEGVVVGNEDRSRAQNPRIVAENGQIHVVWEDDVNGNVRSDVLAATHSTDGGETWSKEVQISIPKADSENRFLSPHEIETTKNGYVHVAVQRAGFGVPKFPTYYVQWNGSEWSQPEALFDFDVTGQYPGLLGTDDQLSIYLVAEVEDGKNGLYRSIGTVE